MIVIIAAMPVEMDALVALGTEVNQSRVEDVQVATFKLGNHHVACALSGVGKINASYTTTLLVRHFNPKLVINIGSAGGLSTNQKVGDIVIADQVRIHDLFIGESTYQDPRFIYDAIPHYVDLSETVAKELGHTTHRGVIVSGDQFVVNGSAALRNIEAHYPEAICAEMEAAAVGGVCTRLKTPFIVIRALSDVPKNEGNEIEFETFVSLASKNSALICEAFVQRL